MDKQEALRKIEEAKQTIEELQKIVEEPEYKTEILSEDFTWDRSAWQYKDEDFDEVCNKITDNGGYDLYFNRQNNCLYRVKVR